MEYFFAARRTGVRNLSFLAVNLCLACISVCLVCAPVEQNVESRAKMQFKQQKWKNLAKWKYPQKGVLSIFAFSFFSESHDIFSIFHSTELFTKK